jgi:hypothetical protein
MTTKKKKFTVPEFKTWLEGIMQFQNKDWSPTREQWDEIYDKIMNLKEPVNKTKIDLTDSSLDEINAIIYENLQELNNQMRQVQNVSAFQPQNTGQQPYPQQPQQPHQPGGHAPVNPAPPSGGNGLENVPLSELKKDYESRQQGISGGTHKLPDVEEGPPDDFV